MWWHEQSWPEIEAADKQTPVIIPLGSCEQHGHHLPVFVDSMQVTAVAEGAEKRLGDRALVLPTLWLGSSHHHSDFPGTVSVEPSLYSQIIQSVTQSILQAGFKRLFFLNGHGGNAVPVQQALTELVAMSDEADEAYLVFSSWWQVSNTRITSDEVGMASPKVTHACEFETSLMLAVRPDLVHPERVAESEPVLKSRFSSFEAGGAVNVFRRWHRMSSTGAMGRPSIASAEKGQRLLDTVVDEVVAFVTEFREWPELPVIGPAGPRKKKVSRS